MLTRRQWLRGCAGTAAALNGFGSFGLAGWSDSRLGVACNLGGDEPTARKALHAAAAAGFRRVQIQFPWAKVGDGFLRALPGWLKSDGLSVDVLGAYVNCCQPENILMDCRESDLPRAIDLAGKLGCRCLAAWTGGYGNGLMKSDPRNQTAEAEDSIRGFAGPHGKRLESAGVTLALESYITLACPDAVSLRRVLNRLPKCVGAVLDPPNLTPVSRFKERDQVLREMVGLLGDRVAVVHLKDFKLAPDKASYQLPGPLGGEMNYPLYAELIVALAGAPPLLAEHLGSEEFAEARRKLLPLFAQAAGRAG